MDNASKRGKDKQAHEKKILTAAERIFCLKGYSDASMDEIAKEALFTKRTVYQYFESKEELYFAVVLSVSWKLFAKIAEEKKKEPAGYDKLEASCRSYYRFFSENPDYVQLINSRGQVWKSTSESGRFKTELIKFYDTMVRDIKNTIEQGKADGSILHRADSEKTALCLMFLLTGFYNQLLSANEVYSDFCQTEKDEINNCIIELAIRPLKRNRTVTATRKGTA